MGETIYTEVTGTTCYVNGERGTVVALHHEGVTGGIGMNRRRTVGAFVKMDGPVDDQGCYLGTGAMLFVTLGNPAGDRGQHHEVTESRVISRDEFDRITGLDQLRRDMGWAA